MPFPTALTSDQLELLRGATGTVPTFASNQFIVLCPNENVFAARVNQSTFATAFATVTFDTVTTGAYTDIQDGMTVLISHTNDRRAAFFVGRARANNSGTVSTSTVLNINETSADIDDNDYLFVLDDYRVHDRLARQVSGVQQKDYDLTFAQLKPLITNLQSAYVGIATGSPTPTFSVSFAADAIAGTSGATISSYLYTTPDGSVTAGSLSTANVTIAFPVGFRWVTLAVTDSGSRTATRRIPVWSVPSDFSSVVTLGFSGASFSRGDGGDASVEAFSGIDTVLDNTLAVVFSQNYYNGSQTDIFTNIDFIGRIRRETDNTTADATYSQVQKASLELEGALSQFSRIEHLPFTLTDKASPTLWDQITALTIWRAILHTLQRHSTYLELFALDFDSTDTTFRYLALPTQGGNILSVIQDLASSINASIEVAPTGETQVVRNANYLTGGQRAALPTILNGTMQDLINIDSLNVSEVDTTGKIQGSGGFYNSTSGKVTPLLSLAPGMAQGIGEGITTFARQVLAANQTQAAAQSELNTRTGHEYEARRREVTTMSLTLPAGYNWIVPSRAAWYTWTIPATENTGGRAFTSSDRWQCIGLSTQQDNAIGKPTVQAQFRLETSGAPGQTVVYPPITQIPPTLPTVPTIPPFPTIPPPPDISLPTDPTPEDAPPYPSTPVATNGNLVATWSTTQVWVAPDVFLTNAPAWTEITPTTSLGIIQNFQWEGLGSLGAYLLTTDGTDSMFHYTTDATNPGAVWVDTSVTGVYERIRVGSTQGQVYIQGQADTTPCTSWTELQFGTTFDGEFGGKQRFTSGAPGEGVGDGVTRIGIVFAVDDCCNFVDYLLTSGSPSAGGFNWIYCGDPITPENLQSSSSWPVPINIDYISAKNNAGDAFTVDLELVAAGGSVVTRYSANNGTTFASPETAGDPP